eukprot:jgi/Ulvmu1/1466/UM011_0196.1
MGFHVPEPESRLVPLPDLINPIVRLGRCSPTEWNAVVFFACTSESCSTFCALEGSSLVPCAVDVMDRHVYDSRMWQFCRIVLPTVKYAQQSQVMNYSIQCKGLRMDGHIPIAGISEEWNLSAYSCYDQRRAIGERLWQDMSEKAANGTRPLHAIMGAGDQLYNDNLWILPPLQAWLKREDKLQFEPDKTMKEAIAEYYCGSYLRHTHYHPAAPLLRNTPQINSWDDHDLMDGFGSYRNGIQETPQFQAVLVEAQRFYLLFQHATTASRAAGDGYIVSAPEPGWPFRAFSFTTQLGPSAAVVAPDSRSQRSVKRILTPETRQRLLQQMKEFPDSVKHVLFISASPIVYPGLGIVEGLLKCFSSAPATNLLLKTGLGDSIYNHFGQPDLLDDVTDHWSSDAHEKEKAELLAEVVDAAKARQFRLTFVAGDVHLCAVTYLKSRGPRGAQQATDPGFVPHIVTSAIGNKPPGDFVVKYLESCVKRFHKVNGTLDEVVADFFDPDMTPTRSRKFNNRQNYCELRVGAPHAQTGLPPLQFSLVVLGGDPVLGDEIGDVVSAVIPPLLPPGTEPAVVRGYELESWKPPGRKMCCF